MNGNVLGIIAGLQRAHCGLTCGTAFPATPGAPTNGPGHAEIAHANGAEGRRMTSADELRPALEASLASDKPAVMDVPTVNNPTRATGHRNILDVRSSDMVLSHVST